MNRAAGALTKAPVRISFLIVWLVILAFGGMAQGKLSSVQENDAGTFLPADAESTRAAAAVSEFVDSSALPIIVVAAKGGEALDDADLKALAAVATSLGDTPLTDPRDGTETTAADLLQGRTDVLAPAGDGAAAIIPLSLPSDVADATGEAGRGVSVVVDALRAAAADADLPAGVTLDVAGPGGYAADLVGAFGGVDLLLLGVALVVVLVILLFVYRSPILPLAVLGADLFALCGAALVVYWLAAADVLTLNGQSQGIMSILVIGATTDYALLLVARYRETLTEVPSPREAMRAAVRGAAPAILASAATVIVGLLALLLSGLASTKSLGPIAAIGITFALLAALTLLPGLLLIAGKRSRGFFWPAIPRATDDAGGAHRLWTRVATWVARHDRAVWLATAVVLVALAAFTPTFKASGTSDSDVLRSASQSTRGNAVLEEHFSAGSVQPVRVIVDEAQADAVAADLASVDGVLAVQSYAKGAPQMGGAPSGGEQGDQAPAPTVVGGRILLDVTTEHLPDDPRSWDTVADVRTVAQDADPGALVGGSAAEKLDTRDTARADIWRVVPVTLAGIFIMLVILLRSLAAPAMLIVANCVSFLATMGLAALAFNHVLDLPGADPSVPLYGFVFLVALGIDYTIFLMTRVREESAHTDTREALRRALATTGGVITSAGLVLAATFAVLSVIPLLFMLQLAVIVAAGVLIDTFVVRTLLVSGLVHDVGDRIWWPSKPRSKRTAGA